LCAGDSATITPKPRREAVKIMKTITKICIMWILAFSLVVGFNTVAETKATDGVPVHDVAVTLHAPKKARDCSTRDKRVSVTVINNGTEEEEVTVELFEVISSTRPVWKDGQVVTVSAGSRARTIFPYSPTNNAGMHDWLATVTIAVDDDPSNNNATAVTETVQCQ
jgi:hypothetical protein